MAVIKASRPSFESQAGRLAYAVHAYFLARGAKVVAVGQRADDAEPDTILTEEVETQGWDDLQDHFAFRYIPESGNTQDALQVMMDVVGNALVVHWAAVTSSRPPRSLQLLLSDFTRDASGVQEGYVNTDKLLDILHENLGDAFSEDSQTVHSSGQAADADSRKTRTPHLEKEGDVDDALTAAEMPLPWPNNDNDRRAAAVGAQDLVPLGLRAPGSLVEPGGSHLGYGGGGMHVGLDDPVYNSRLRQGGRGVSGGVPGARFDPINPQGLPGWNPDDFQQQGNRGLPHPDIMPPGPDRGTDFNSMFG